MKIPLLETPMPSDNIYFELGNPSILTLNFFRFTRVYSIELTKLQYKWLNDYSSNEKQLAEMVLDLLAQGKLKGKLIKHLDMIDKYPWK